MLIPPIPDDPNRRPADDDLGPEWARMAGLPFADNDEDPHREYHEQMIDKYQAILLEVRTELGRVNLEEKRVTELSQAAVALTWIIQVAIKRAFHAGTHKQHAEFESWLRAHKFLPPLRIGGGLPEDVTFLPAEKALRDAEEKKDK